MEQWLGHERETVSGNACYKRTSPTGPRDDYAFNCAPRGKADKEPFTAPAGPVRVNKRIKIFRKVLLTNHPFVPQGAQERLC